MFSSLKAIK